MIIDIKQELVQLSEPEYQKFNARLLPGVENILGVRLPNLRKLAKKLAKQNWKDYLDQAQDTSFEEIMLQGMVIGYAKPKKLSELLPYIEKHIRKINNWSTCDSFCSGLKITKENPDVMWKFLQPYFHSDQEFDIRFAVVMGLNYYITDTYKEGFLQLLNQIDHEGYYVKMAVAWAVSMIYIYDPVKTKQFLRKNSLNDFTHNKSIQKIRESYQVSKEEKSSLILLRRQLS